MRRTVQKRMEEFHMVSSGDTVLAGVSGGADSTCLLLVLAALREEMDFSLEVVHIEHGIRGEESKKDAAFVEAFCRRMEISCHIEAVDVPGFCEETGMGTEEAARILRYRTFARMGKQLKAKVALAHNMEDNAETVLFQMARGSALTGLCGMQPVRKDEDGVTYIRPLLSVHRKEIEDFLKAQGAEFCTDSTNAQLDYTRNYIRKVVLPDLKNVNAQVVEHVHGAAGTLSEVKDYLTEEVEHNWVQVAVSMPKEVATGVRGTNRTSAVRLDIEKLSSLHKVLQKEIVYRAIAEVSGGKKDITTTHVQEVLALCENQSGKRIYLPNEVEARREFDCLRLYKKDQDVLMEDITWEVLCDQMQKALETGQNIEIPLLEQEEKIRLSIFRKMENTDEIPQKRYTKWLDYDKIKTGFCIRTRKSGDYLISDVAGHRKKLKQYFIEEKISVSDRNNIWLLAQESKIFWVVGGRISEHVKVTKDTKTIIEITYDGGK